MSDNRVCRERRLAGATSSKNYTAVAWSTHHYVDLNIYQDHLLIRLIRAIDQDGEQFDEVTIPATPAP